VINNCQNGTADQDLAPGIAFAFGLADARDHSVLLHTQAGQPLVKRLQTDADFLGLWHWASFGRLSAMQVQCRSSVGRERRSNLAPLRGDIPPAGRREPAEGALWRF
jgi:hypothetical protein